MYTYCISLRVYIICVYTDAFAFYVSRRAMCTHMLMYKDFRIWFICIHLQTVSWRSLFNHRNKYSSSFVCMLYWLMLYNMCEMYAYYTWLCWTVSMLMLISIIQWMVIVSELVSHMSVIVNIYILYLICSSCWNTIASIIIEKNLTNCCKCIHALYVVKNFLCLFLANAYLFLMLFTLVNESISKCNTFSLYCEE